MIDEAAVVGDLQLDPGYWILGFYTEPPPARDPRHGTNYVDSADGAVAAVRVDVTMAAGQAWADARPPGTPSLAEVLSSEIAGAMFVLERMSRQS